MEGAGEAGDQRALAVCFVQKPQDGSADALLDVVLTPSYVYYSGGWGVVVCAYVLRACVCMCVRVCGAVGFGGSWCGRWLHAYQVVVGGDAKPSNSSSSLPPAACLPAPVRAPWRCLQPQSLTGWSASSRPRSSWTLATSAPRPPPRYAGRRWYWQTTGQGVLQQLLEQPCQLQPRSCPSLPLSHLSPTRIRP